MMHMVFEQVKLSADKHGYCDVCGKKARRQIQFMQTISQFNKNPDGSMKNRNDILIELRKQAEQYKQLPVLHVRCEK